MKKKVACGRILNFGHTFAHAIESTTGYGRYQHGEAVALGMVAATTLAVKQSLIERAVARSPGHAVGESGAPDDRGRPAR